MGSGVRSCGAAFRVVPVIALTSVTACWSARGVEPPAETPAAAGANLVPDDPSTAKLAAVERWVIQLQGLEDVGAIGRLAGVPADLVVVEPMRSQRGFEEFPMAEAVARIQAPRFTTGRRRVCLAYLNVGQAEDYRTYWTEGWRAPTEDAPGLPSFLLTVDPDGWVGNYPVAYWDARWRGELLGHPGAPLDQILADGFDGVYLDWVLGYGDPAVVAAARDAAIDPEEAMVDWLTEVRDYARRRNPAFVLIAQNAIALVERHPRMLAVIDGLVQEDLSFRGRADAAWDDDHSGGIAGVDHGPWSTAVLGRRLAAAREAGLTVLTLDYAVDPADVLLAERVSRGFGLLPAVSRTPLDRLPEHIWNAVPAR